jgi:protein-disulfide isomerase
MSTLKNPINEADHIEGDKDAPITLVEYADYECPYCGSADPVIKRIQKHYGTRLRFVFRNFPLIDSHPHALAAAMTAEFAAENDKFWEMHDMLYKNQNALDMQNLLNYVNALGLSEADFQHAMENATFGHKIKKDFEGGVKSGVNGTPCIFINGHRYDGPTEYDALVSAIDQSEAK